MKINETQRVSGINNYRKHHDTKPSSAGRKGIGRDEVQISNEAKEMLVSNDSTQQKVDELKKSVSSGSYKVDAGKLANKLLPFLFK